MKTLTRRELIIYSAGLGTLAIGGWLAKDMLDFQECVDKGIEIREKMYGTKKLSDYVASEVKRNCGWGKER
jgi:hypothetical protein